METSDFRRWRLWHLGRGDSRWRARKDPVRGRRRALREEVGYWRDWIATSGGKWPDEFAYRFDPSSEVSDAVLRAAIAGTSNDTVSIIDVGSGPASMVGSVFPGKKLALVAVDPLADEYNRLLDEFGIAPPVRPTRAEGEHLLETFGPDRFDLAYSRNALDHAVDPVRIIENMVGVLRPGGSAVLRHVRNEGVRNAYVELHQWNFDTRDDHLIAWRPGVEVDITTRLAGRAEVECSLDEAEDAAHAQVVARVRKLELTR
jgi:SAM-dependent methyltransferase